MPDIFENQSHTSRLSKLKRVYRRVVPERIQLLHTSEANSLLSLIWVVSGFVSVLAPLIYRSVHKYKYRQEYLKYYWEQEYEQYEQQRQQNYQMYGNAYNAGNYGEEYQEYQEQEYVDVNNCKWWDLNCFSFFVNGEGEAKADQEWAPTWYRMFITSDEERQEMQDNLESPGSLKFVYIWQILMFIVIGVYGLKVIRENRNPTGLMIALLVWANFAFLSMWLMADGSIVTDGQEVKRMGFYGQMSVLVFMSNFWYFIHGMAFVLVFWLRAKFVEDEKEEVKEASKDVDGSYDAPVVA